MTVPGFNIEDFYSRVAYTISYNLTHMDDLINKVTPTLDSIADNTNLQGIGVEFQCSQSIDLLPLYTFILILSGQDRKMHNMRAILIYNSWNVNEF